MASARGCLKFSLIGCGALILLSIAGTAGLMAFVTAGSRDAEVRREAAAAAAAPKAIDAVAVDLTRTHPGRVLLDLRQGEFSVRPAEPGAGLAVHAEFDETAFALEQGFAMAPDSSWTAAVSMHRTISGFEALVRQIRGEKLQARVTIDLPADVPIELAAAISQGGAEIELGGLWLRTVDLTLQQGGCALSCREPVREPLARMRLDGRMGGVQAERLGNLSPRILELSFGMGGADVDLDGEWRNDCDARISAKLGGVSVRAPRDLRIEAVGPIPKDVNVPAPRPADPEVPEPVMRIEFAKSLGGIDISQ
ncbi:MAG TPA: hypothetical protein PLQ13_00085 [Candidatus Krumholzibacteria bacterium]|nr:hypothetical protein [Candidatus Krumholzibacteria bacterium]